MKDIITSALLLLAFTVVLGLAYPMAVWSVAQVAFPQQANGSLLVTDGQTIGSELIGQQFTGDKYFHGRLSANNYDAANSGGTNLAPTSKKVVGTNNYRRGDIRRKYPGGFSHRFGFRLRPSHHPGGD